MKNTPGSEYEHNNHSSCVETQAIVIPGPKAERGQGIQSGFKCLCFFSMASDDVSNCLHVILHDWYEKEEALGTENMLMNSNIKCNNCHRNIKF